MPSSSRAVTHSLEDFQRFKLLEQTVTLNEEAGRFVYLTRAILRLFKVPNVLQLSM